jgi:hypothetical protein
LRHDGTKENEMRVSFSSMTTARAVVNLLEAYGYSANQFGREVVTDCPMLLAIPAIQKRVGFAEIERLDLTGGTVAFDAMAGLPSGASAARSHPGGEATG